MADHNPEPPDAQRMFGDFAPALVGLTDDILFGQVSTLACLTTSGNTEQLGYRLGLAKQNRRASTNSSKRSPTWPSMRSDRKPCPAMGAAKQVFAGNHAD
jgi:4-carboxymuconolactone decarboxylase